MRSWLEMYPFGRSWPFRGGIRNPWGKSWIGNEASWTVSVTGSRLVPCRNPRLSECAGLVPRLPHPDAGSRRPWEGPVLSSPSADRRLSVRLRN